MKKEFQFRFGSAPIKAEGTAVYTDKELAPYKDQIKTVYVERRVPMHLEKEAHAAIDRFLVRKGYDPEEI